MAEHEAHWFWKNVASGVGRSVGRRVEQVAVELERWRRIEGVYEGVVDGKSGEGRVSR